MLLFHITLVPSVCHILSYPLLLFLPPAPSPPTVQLTGIAAILRFGIPELEEELPVDGDEAGSESDLSSGYDSDSDDDDENALSGDRATIQGGWAVGFFFFFLYV